MDNSTYISSKKVLIDTAFLFDQYSHRGIGRYGKELLRRLIPLLVEENTEVHLAGFLDLKLNLIELKFSNLAIEEIINKIQFHSFGEPVLSSTKNKNRWEAMYGKVINEVSPDIFFAVHFERGLPSVPALKSKIDVQVANKLKTIVAVHDVIPIVTDTFSSKSFIHNFLKKRFYMGMFEGVVNSDVIITPSDFSKNDIIKVTGVDPQKVIKTYYGIDDMFYPENNKTEESIKEALFQKFQIKDKKYFFFDSGLEENKGLQELAAILSFYFKKKKKDADYIALTTGRDLTPGVGKQIKAKTKLGKRFIKAAKENGIIENVVALGKVTDEELVSVLQESVAYLYLSKYEGFGFGPLQAMASEIPAVAANISCIPEVTRGGALLIDIFNPKQAAKEIDEHLKAKNKIDLFKTKGKQIALEYDWATTAKQTLDVIQKLLKY